jgi:hypothetical protein
VPFYGATTGPASTHVLRGRYFGGSGVTYAAPPSRPTFNSASVASDIVGVNTVVVNAPAGITSGDLLVCCISSLVTGGVDWTPPSGWSEIGTGRDSGGNGGRMSIFTKTATGAEPSTYTFTGNHFSTATILDYQGASALDGAPVLNSSNSAPSGPLRALTITATGTNETLVCAYAPTNGAAVNTPPGLTSRATFHNAIGTSMAVFTLDLTSTGATGNNDSSSVSGFGYTSASILLKH